ncbi:hypothetical protein [Demequina rhizosphaerae]|uniref:hypothetical protein n=1 Tax=Demequina rhizosphaerae TaxID=1638985 RepID=UPI0012E0C32A|nr:hypothetical protein [Demequina rhizosphaerae]
MKDERKEGLKLPWGWFTDIGVHREVSAHETREDPTYVERSFVMRVTEQMYVVLFDDYYVIDADEGFAIHRDVGSAVLDGPELSPEVHDYVTVWHNSMLPTVHATKGDADEAMIQAANREWTGEDLVAATVDKENPGEIVDWIRLGRICEAAGVDPRFISLDDIATVVRALTRQGEIAALTRQVEGDPLAGYRAFPLDEVNVINEPGMYRIRTESTAVYYVDTRGEGRARMMRDPGDSPHSRASWDGTWVPLIGVTAGPIVEIDGRVLADGEVDATDVRSWVLRVGSRHEYIADPAGGLVGDYRTWMQRVCTHIDRLPADPID